MVGKMTYDFSISNFHPGLASFRALLTEMETLYHDLDAKLANVNNPADCTACGKCCDFEAFGHKLYLTTPELLFFAHHVSRPFKQMTEGVCPYRIGGKCSVYSFRFAACRIFLCKSSAMAQNELTESTLARLKHICTQYTVPYYYVDLKTALRDTEPTHP